MSTKLTVVPEPDENRYRTMTVPELRALWQTNRNSLVSLYCADELMRRYDRGELEIRLTPKVR